MTQEDIVILSQLLDQKFEPVYTRLDLLESDVRELKSGMSEIKQRVASVEQKVTELDQRVASVEQKVTKLFSGAMVIFTSGVVTSNLRLSMIFTGFSTAFSPYCFSQFSLNASTFPASTPLLARITPTSETVSSSGSGSWVSL